MKPELRQVLYMLAKLGVSISILAYLVEKIQWREVHIAAKTMGLSWLILAFLLYGAAYLVIAIRWFLLLRIQQIIMTLPTVVKLTLIGAFFNTFLLGSTGGDMAKLVYVFRKYPDKKTHATLSVMMDRMLGLLVLLLMAFGCMFFKLDMIFTRQDTLDFFLITGIASVVTVAFGLLLLFIPTGKNFAISIKRWQNIPGYSLTYSIMQMCRQYRDKRMVLLAAVICSFIVQSLVFVYAFLLSQAIGMQVNFIDLVIIVSLVTCIISLPVSLGGHGLREGAFLLIFPMVVGSNGEATLLSNEMIILFSLLYFIVGIGWSLLGGVVYLFYNPEQKGNL